ncbi:hypothetical protein LSAT2_014879 [Lamellibrachia satsuma]|nr:hypothetical protein LSAT2_014879 [Lamellibrachia satsuma]
MRWSDIHYLLHSWNPMLEDYESEFNSYDSGPGRDLPLSRQRPRRPDIGAGDMSASSPKTDDMIQLYVTGIPNEMNDDGLTNLFSQVGKVMYAHKCAATSTKFETSYGFVKFARPDEASAAIAKFNNFPIQQKYRLRVSIALNAEQKAQRAEQRKKQDEFLNSLSSANVEGSNDTTAPPGRMNGTPQNGNVAAPTSGSALGRERSTKTGTGLGKMPNVASTQFNQSPGVSAPGTGRGFNPCYSPIQGVVGGRVNGTAASVCGSDDGSVHSEGRRRAKRQHKPIGPCCVCKTAKVDLSSLVGQVTMSISWEHFEIWVRARLVPRNTSTKTGSWRK